ncbi:DUF3488 domain-containing protein, partial [Paracidovorax avenae]
LPLPGHLPPRAMAQQVRDRFGESAEPAAGWLLRMDQARYARDPGATLAGLRRELRGLRWPSSGNPSVRH